MIRVLNFFCFALTALACLALYHVSEKTRVARIALHTTQQQIASEQETMKVLQADWQRVSDPVRIQQLAVAKLGIADTPAISLASLELLPRRSEAKDLQQANADAPARPSDPRLKFASLRSGE